MKVVDTFLFAESYEAELLLIKLTLESPLIDRWVLVESDHTFRGDFKGFHARKLVYGDERFAPYRDRLTIVEHEGWVHPGPQEYQTYYQNEELSRRMAFDAVEASYADEAWLLVSDVDEAVDCTHSGRLETFLNHLKANAGRTVYFGHYRYWYDFDNRCYWTGIMTPATQFGSVRNGRSSTMCRAREASPNRVIHAGDFPLFFEYTFCFPQEAMWKKLNSFIHDGYTEDDLKVALLTNHWVKAPARGERPGDQKVDWLETVALDHTNSPAYVRENLARLKTGAVAPDYLEHRKRLYRRGPFIP